MKAETTRLLAWAGGLSLVAGFVHGASAEAHFLEWWGYGVFFTLSAMAQGLYGFFLAVNPVVSGAPITQTWTRGQRRRLYLAGIVGNVAVVVLYVITRTVGIPLLGPAAGQTEDWDALGVFTKLVELALIGVLAVLAQRAGHAPEPAREGEAEPAPA